MPENHPSTASAAQALRARLVRNFDDAVKSRELRAPLYDSQCARLAEGTAARRLGISIDIVAPGMRSCPYHYHLAQEEAFVILEGEGTLRVAGERLALRAGDTVFIPPGREYPHQIVPFLQRARAAGSGRSNEPATRTPEVSRHFLLQHGRALQGSRCQHSPPHRAGQGRHA